MIKCRQEQIKALQLKNMASKKVLGRDVAEIRRRLKIGQNEAAKILDSEGVVGCNIIAIEAPSARRSASAETSLKVAETLLKYL